MSSALITSRGELHADRGTQLDPNSLVRRDPPMPRYALVHQNGEARVALAGSWTFDHAEEVQRAIQMLVSEVREGENVVFDLFDLAKLDTLGAWVLHRTCIELRALGRES